MRILLWHGYLLGGTGSNVYTRALAREWSNSGHEIVLFCQERHPERYDIGSASLIRPEIGTLLPVFVLDCYEGLEARLLQDLSRAELELYTELNAAELRRHLPADLVFANHVLPGGAIAAAAGAPFAVKAHGSELEYSMRGNRELEEWGRRSLEHASAVFVGSEHIRRALEEVVGAHDRIYEVPPGVDIEAFAPRERGGALAALIAEARRDPANPGGADERLPDEGNADRFNAFFSEPGPTVVYLGKLLENKGVHLLLEALRGLDAKAVVVGFGDYRSELERLAGARVLFTGALEHRHLVELLPLADVAVVPSIYPEAFGMVAAEAAASGVPPLVARHSGLMEIAAGLEREYPSKLRDLASFAGGDVADLRAKLEALLSLSEADREALGRAARRAAVNNWGWSSVAGRLLEPFTI
ncbi:MAG: glycosyltransferase family 4 protein [Gaiellaceae bacterium]